MQQLPAKDQAVFRSIVKFYETKQYKKGVKAADSILKKHPEHGETLCMKGLTLSYLEKKEEAYDLVRKGLKHDLRSHVCWHVFGLLYRQDRDYFEAVKCYRQALRIDPENIQILRDLSLLQIHRRDVSGFAETRRKLLQLKSSNRLNWVGYAIAEHLCKSFEFAWTCIDNYENSFKEGDNHVSDYENSELYVYKATIMEEAGKYEDALECIRQNETKIVDKIGQLEMKGRLCMYLGRFEESAEIWKRLLKCNTEHHTYALALLACQPESQSFWPALPPPVSLSQDDNSNAVSENKPPSTISSFPPSMHPAGMPVWGWLPPQHKPQTRVVVGRKQHKRQLEVCEPLVPLTDEQEDQVCKFFDGLLETYPRSDSLKRMPLNFVTGLRFKRLVDTYMRSRLRKGVPSLFRMLRQLYFQSGKPALMEELLLQYKSSLEAEVAWFGPRPGQDDEKPPQASDEEAPSCLLFVLMVLAEHYDFMGAIDKALETINLAIDYTPTMVEVYMCKARIYRHAGDLEASARIFEEVRQMDLADRFLNCVCVKSMLRIDDVQGGMEKALLFSKEPGSAEAANLHDMQCMWIESAVGRSYFRQKKYGMALKQFHETFKHFADIAEDQFDFHNYCLRKTTLKAYVAMLRMQDRLYSHKFYRRAAKDAIRIYLELFDSKVNGAKSGNEGDADGDDAEMSAEDKKKAKHKKKREAEAAAKKKAPATTTEAAKSGKPKKVDEDPDGDKLLQQDPMEQAVKLAKNLVLYAASDAASHVLTYDIFSRQGKLLHCIQALRKLWELAGHDVLHYKLVAPLSHFCFVMDLANESTSPAVREVVLSELAPILLGDDSSPAFESVAALRKAATEFVDKVERRLKECKDLPVIEVFYGLKCMKSAGRDCKGFLEAWKPQSVMALKECRKLLGYLSQEYGKDSASFQPFQTRCKEVFPLMVCNLS